MDNKKMTFQFGVSHPGERSAGIWPSFVEIQLIIEDEFFLGDDNDSATRMQFIEEFKAFLAPWMDEPMRNIKTHEEWERIAKDEFEAERLADEAEAAMAEIEYVEAAYDE